MQRLVPRPARFGFLAVELQQLRVAFFIVKAAKPSPCPKHPTTLGQHLKKRRMELRLRQKEVADRLGLDECTVGNWEMDRTYPAVGYMPRLIQYLDYDPFPQPRSLGERLQAKRQELGLSRKRLAALIGIDDGTLQRYEHGVWQPGLRNRAILERFLGSSIE